MAWRIDKHIVRGLIQNFTRGRVVGTLWLKGLDNPIQLELEGNCLRDLAGTRMEFRNPDAIVGEYDKIELLQEGKVGDITASRKVKTYADDDIPFPEAETGEMPAFMLANCLYIEWFSEANGRLLIESTDYVWKVSLPKWRMTEAEEKAQLEANRAAMFSFIKELTRAFSPNPPDEDETSDNMNEFQWEAFLQKNDVRADMLLELFEKYEDHPNCEQIIADAMGWDVESVELSDVLYDDWDDADDEIEDTAADEAAFDEEPLPGHPLIASMMELTSRLYYEAETRKLLSADTANPWNQLIWNCQLTTGKLAAALDMISEDFEPEPGFVIASLKRGLHLLHLTISTLEACSNVGEDYAWTGQIKKDLFELRENVIDTMQSYRDA